MRRMVLGSLTAGLLVATSACGGGGSSADEAKTPASTSTPTDDATDIDGVDTKNLGKIIAGDPTDVVWSLPDVPPSWEPQQTDPGEKQWRVGDTCVVTLFQPAGLGTDVKPSQEDVLQEFAGRTRTSVGGTLEVAAREPASFPLFTGTDGVRATTRLARASLTGPGGIEGEIYAYRSGDFALVANTMCGKGAFADVDTSDFQPFIKGLGVSATY